MRRRLTVGLLVVGAALAIATPAQGASGTFERAWGRDVVSGNVEDGFEICTAAASCKTGLAGLLGGELSNPRGVAADAAGNVYVADTDNNRIEKFDSSGNFRRAWGKDVIATGDPADTGDGFEICRAASGDTCQSGTPGGGLGGELSGPIGVATDGAENVYVADTLTHRIQMFDSSGSFLRAWGKDVIDPGGPPGTGFEICTAAASCQMGTAGGLGGELKLPEGVAADGAGNVYVADTGNHRIQQFDSSQSPLPQGSFLRAWGKDVVSGNAEMGFEVCTSPCKAGSNATALGGELSGPGGVAADAAGNVYVADTSNNRIQRFDSSGSFSRAWGNDVASAGPGNTGPGFEICVAANGDTCKAGSNVTALGGELNVPAAIAADGAGNVYVADHANQRIQNFNSSGAFLSAWGADVVSGNAVTGFEICTAATTCKIGLAGGLGGELSLPRGVAADAAGNVYVAEFGNQRIQKFVDAPPLPGGPGTSTGGSGTGLQSTENPLCQVLRSKLKKAKTKQAKKKIRGKLRRLGC